MLVCTLMLYDEDVAISLFVVNDELHRYASCAVCYSPMYDN